MLRQALEHLASDAEEQQRHLRELGTWPSLDELALELDDVKEPAERSESELLRERVRLLGNKLDAMSGPDHVGLWRGDALTRPEWSEARRLAADALAALG